MPTLKLPTLLWPALQSAPKQPPGRSLFALCAVLAVLLAGCATDRNDANPTTRTDASPSNPKEAKPTTLVQAPPIQRGTYWDDRGVQVEVRTAPEGLGAPWVFVGEVQSVNRDFIDVSSIQLDVDGKSTTVQARLVGSSIDDVARGTSCWREQFVAFADPVLLSTVVSARAAAVRVVGASDSTSWIRVSEDAKLSLGRQVADRVAVSGGSRPPANRTDPLPPPSFTLAALEGEGIQVDDPWKLTKGTADWWAGTARKPWPGSSTDPVPSEISYFVESRTSTRVQKLTVEAEIYNPARFGAAMKAEFARVIPILFSKLGVEPPPDLSSAIRSEERVTWEMPYGTVSFAREPYKLGYGLTLIIKAKD